MARYGTLLERFEDKYVPEPNSGCWLWIGNIGKSGYGKLKLGEGRKSIRAHRASWELYRGNIPAGMNVLHRCDLPCCVNPDHLFVGTNWENSQDAVVKGRLASATNGRHHATKLSTQDVVEIKNSTERADCLAKRFGVHLSTIYEVRNGTIRTKG